MTMAYSSFKGATGRHGPSVTRKMAMALKEYMARRRRKRRQVTTPPRYNKRRNWKRRYGYACSRRHKGR